MNKILKYAFFVLHISISACDTNKIVEKKVNTFISHSDIDSLFAYLSDQENNNNSAAYFQHGYLYICGVVPKNAKLANFYFLKTIELAKNNIRIKRIAQKAMADSLYSGDGCEKSLKLAHDYYLTSAKSGYVPSMFNVAITFKELGHHKKYLLWMQKHRKSNNHQK